MFQPAPPATHHTRSILFPSLALCFVRLLPRCSQRRQFLRALYVIANFVAHFALICHQRQVRYTHSHIIGEGGGGGLQRICRKAFLSLPLFACISARFPTLISTSVDAFTSFLIQLKLKNSVIINSSIYPANLRVESLQLKSTYF